MEYQSFGACMEYQSFVRHLRIMGLHVCPLFWLNSKSFLYLCIFQETDIVDPDVGWYQPPCSKIAHSCSPANISISSTVSGHC